MTLEEIGLTVSISATAISVITTVIATIKKEKTNKKNKLLEITNKIPGYVTEAEEIFGKGKGLAKMTYVLNLVQMDCLKANTEYNEEEVKEAVENVLQAPTKVKEEKVEEKTAVSYAEAQKSLDVNKIWSNYE